MNRQRMTSVLRVRTLQERAARGALGASRHAHRQAELAELRTWRELDGRLAHALGEMSSVGDVPAAVPAPTLVGLHLGAAAGVRAAETQHTTTLVAADAVAAAMDQWTIAARRVEGLERLVQRHREIDRDEAVRVAANEIDDLVLVRFAGGAL